MPPKRGSRPSRQRKNVESTFKTLAAISSFPLPSLSPSLVPRSSRSSGRVARSRASKLQSEALPKTVNSTEDTLSSIHSEISTGILGSAPSSTLVGSSQPSAKRKRRSDETPSVTESDEEPLMDTDALLDRLFSTDNLAPTSQDIQGEADEDEVVLPIFRPTRLPAGVEKGYSILVLLQKNYWPGYLVDFRPAQSRAAKDEYIVHVHEAGEMVKRRREVIFMVDEGIADCSRGHILITKDDIVSDAATRAATPPIASSSSLIASSTPFRSLSRREQINNIRPHLVEIISETYQPAQWRVDRFFGKAKERDGLKHLVTYGDIQENEVSSVIIPELLRWGLRAERWVGFDDASTRTAEQSRPAGSARYQSLTVSGRRRFATDVLLPEAIIELCLRSEEIPLSTSIDAESDRYLRAQDRLQTLASENVEVDWAVRYMELADARARMRKRLRFPTEGMTEEEKKKERLSDKRQVESFFSGRIRRRLFNEVG